MSFSLALSPNLQLDWATTTVRLLGPATQTPRHAVKCLAQKHNKRACRLVLHTIPFVLRTNQESSVCYFLDSFRMTRETREAKPRYTGCKVDAQITTPSHRYKEQLLVKTHIKIAVKIVLGYFKILNWPFRISKIAGKFVFFRKMFISDLVSSDTSALF